MIGFHALHDLRRYAVPRCWAPHTQTHVGGVLAIFNIYLYLLLTTGWPCAHPPPLAASLRCSLRVLSGDDQDTPRRCPWRPTPSALLYFSQVKVRFTLLYFVPIANLYGGPKLYLMRQARVACVTSRQKYTETLRLGYKSMYW